MHLISDLEIGGAQESLRGLVKYQTGDEFIPMVCSFADGPLRPRIEELGVRVEILPERRYSVVAFPFFLFDMIRIWKNLVAVISKYHIDILQTHLLWSLDFLAWCLLFTTPLPAVLWTFHNSNFELNASKLPRYRFLLRPKKSLYRLLYRRCSPHVSGIIAVSNEVKKALVTTIGPIGHKIFVICNGVDVARYPHPVDRAVIRKQLGLDSGDLLLIVVATLKEQKGHAYLIEALRSLSPKYPRLRAIFVGDGDLRRSLMRQIRQAHLERCIQMLGNRQDVAALLAASDLFVLPSLWEGLSVALLEAQASGLPVVATEVSGTRQVIVPGETGVIVAPGDSGALAEAIEQVITDPVKARKLGQAGRTRVQEDFTARKQADQHCALYRRLLQKPRKVGSKAHAQQ